MKKVTALTAFSAVIAASLVFPSIVSAVDNYSFSATPGASGGQVVLNWKQVKPDVQSYNVFYGTEPGKFEFSAVNVGGSGVGKDISFTVNYLKPGVKYYFGLSPVSYKKASPPSVVTDAVSNGGEVTPPPTPPSPSGPTGPVPTIALTGPIAGDTFKGQGIIGSEGAGAHHLSAKKGDKPGDVTLSWDRAFSNVDGYSVVYGTEPGKFQYGANNIGNTTSFTVHDLNPGEKYYFALVPQKGGKAQYISAQVTQDSTPGVPENPQAPSLNTAGSPPTNAPALTGPVPEDSIGAQSVDAIKSEGVGKHSLSVKETKSGEVVLEWQHAFKDTDNYDVVYGTEPGKFQYGALNVGKTTSFTIKDLDPNKKYYFALVPVKGGKAQYITQQVTSEGAPPATTQETQTSGGTQPTGGSAPVAPGMPLPLPGSAPAVNQTQTGKSGGGGTTTTTTSNTSGGSSGQESKKESKKEEKSKKKDVKGIYTILPWFLNLIGF